MSEAWLKFYPTDWRSDPRLRMCGIAARGLWIEMIALMHEAVPYGHLVVSGHSPTDTQLAVLAGIPSIQIPDLIGELEAAGVFSRTKEGVIYSRKLTRMAKKAAIARKNGKNGGNPSLGKQTTIPASDNLEDKGDDKPQKPDTRYQKEQKPLAQHLDSARVPDVNDRLLEAAGIRGNLNTALAFAGPIFSLIDAGYSLEQDILPALRSKPKPDARGWSYFVPQIEEFRKRRLGALERTTPDPLTKLAAWPLERWQVVVDQFKATNEWQRQTYGPRPGEPGCLVPTSLLPRAAA